MTALITGCLDFVAESLSTLLPVYDLSQSNYDTVASAISTVADFLRQVNFIVPLSDIMAMIGIDLGIRIFKFALFVGNWVIRRVADIIP